MSRFASPDLAFGSFLRTDHCYGFLDASGACFRLLGALDPIDKFLLVRVREGRKRLGLGRSFRECGVEVGGHIHGTWGVVQDQFDLHGIAGGRAGAGENVFADAKDVDAGARDEGVAKGEAVDGGADRDLALTAEDFRDAERDLEIGPCAAGAASDELGFELEGVGLGFGHRGSLQQLNRTGKMTRAESLLHSALGVRRSATGTMQASGVK